MDLRRLRAGEIIAGLSGLLLVIALFLPWYTHDVATSFGPRPSTWSRRTPSRRSRWPTSLLLVIAVAAIGLAVDTAVEKTVAVPIAYASLLSRPAWSRWCSCSLHLGASPDPDRACEPETRVETGTAGGVYLALVASIGMFAGSLLAMRDERLSKRGRLTDATGRPVETAPEPELLVPRRRPAQ